MQPFDESSNTATHDDCAALVLETMPRVMSAFRAEMRRYQPPELTVPQFRALMFTRDNAETSLSDVAEFLGLNLSATSRLVDGLVKRNYLTRDTSPVDRRRVMLLVTEQGLNELARMHRQAVGHLGHVLQALNDEERVLVIQGMRALQRVCASHRE